MKIKSKHIDLAIEILLLAIIFLAPTIFDRRIGIVFSGTKAVVIRLFILTFLTLWSVKLLLFKEHKFLKTVFDWPVFTFMLICTASTITSIHVYSSLVGFYGRYEGLISWYCFGLLFFVATNYLADMRALKRVLAVVMSAATLMAVYGIIQRFGIDPYAWGGVATRMRVIATIGQPNFLAAYIVMAFMLVLAFLFLDNGEKPREQTKAKNKTKVSVDSELQKYLPLCYFLLVPILFIIMIYYLDGFRPFLWYLFFVVLTFSGLRFAYTYEQLPRFVFNVLIVTSLSLMYICLFYTQSRGGYLGFLVGIVLVAVFTPRKKLFASLTWILVLLASIAVASGITLMDADVSPFTRFSSEVKVAKPVEGNSGEGQATSHDIQLSGAAGSRGETWKSAFNIISDYPFFGIGPEVMKMVFPQYETELFRFKEDFHVKQDRCHNETFDIPVTKGLLGFLVYWGLVGYVFLVAIKKNISLGTEEKVLSAVLIASMASYIVQNQFSFGVVAIVSIFWVMWAMVAVLGRDPVVSKDETRDVRDLPWIFIAIILIIFAFISYISLFSFTSDLHFKSGKVYSDAGRFEQAITYFNDSLRVAPYEGNTITYLGIATVNYAQRLSGEQRNAMLARAMDIFTFGTRVDPYNADNFHIKARIYLQLGDVEKARHYADLTLKIDPYYAEAYIALAKIAERRGDKELAFQYYKEANRINPNLEEPLVQIGFRLINENKLDKAFKMFEEMMMLHPQNIDAHNGLGAIYLKRGDLAKARSEFEQVLSLDPNNVYAKNMMSWLR
ncbi:MAG: tetratricopeptide repeat protein [Candidatus Margulisiibacteriota bacterium]